MDTLILVSPPIIITLLAAALLSKIALFIKFRTKNWRLFNFFYFNPEHIILSESSKRAEIKKLQNGLTITVIILLTFEILMLLLSRANHSY